MKDNFFFLRGGGEACKVASSGTFEPQQDDKHRMHPEDEFLNEIQTNVLRVFLLVIHSLLYSFAWDFFFFKLHASSYSFCKGERS
jgi:hypothetical protein